MKNISFNIIYNDHKSSLLIKNNLIKEIDAKGYQVDENSLNIIVIGGDGTFLKVFKKYCTTSAKILLINTGSIGFYEAISPNEYKLALKIFEDNEHFVRPEIITAMVNNKKYFAINDIVVSSYNVLKMKLYIDNILYQNFKGTGVCLSSATGSTGYNKSLLGAVIIPQLNVWQLTEIAPTMHANHKSLGNSIILSSKNIVDIEITKNHENVGVIIDGDVLNIVVNEKINIKCENAKAEIFFNQNLKNYIQKIKNVFLGEKND